MDSDVESMSQAQLVTEIKKLRSGIRAHRDCSSHDLCWYHPHLWSLLPETSEQTIEIPEWPQFIRGCIKYRQSLDQQLTQAKKHDKEFW